MRELGRVLASVLLGLIVVVPLGIDLQTVVERKRRPTNNFLFLVDKSGSMDGLEFSKAVSAFLLVGSQPVDHGQFTVWCFDDGVHRWPEGWQDLPSKEGIDKAAAWIVAQGAAGDTLVVPALEQAYRLNKPAELTVILITDGQFHSEHLSTIQVTLATERLKRKKRFKQLKRAHKDLILGVLGVGGERVNLSWIGKFGKGGYYRIKDSEEGRFLGPHQFLPKDG